MRYYFAIMKEAMVHTAIKTKQLPDCLIQIDITRIDAFNEYDKLDELVIYAEESQAKTIAMRKYLSLQVDKNPEGASQNTPRLFRHNSRRPSNNENLKALYGADNVLMETKPVPMLYQLEAPSDLISVDKDGFKVSKELKEKVILQQVNLFDVVFYLTSRYANEKKLPTTLSTINHQDLSPLSQPAPLDDPANKVSSKRGGCMIS